MATIITKDTITIADMNWASASVQANVIKTILEDGYGYPVELVAGTTYSTFDSMNEKDTPDIAPELWTSVFPEPELFDIAVTEGRLVVNGEGLDAVEGFYIDEYTANLYNIDSIEDMLDPTIAQLFSEDDNTPVLMNAPPIWSAKISNEVLYYSLGLDAYYDLVETSSAAELNNHITSNLADNTPVFTYYWQPTAIGAGLTRITGFLDASKIDTWNTAYITYADGVSPEQIDEVRALALDGYPDSTVELVATKSFSDNHPEVTTFLENFDMNSATLSTLVKYMEENDLSGEQAAQYYLQNNDEWQAWASNDAVNALAEAIGITINGTTSDDDILSKDVSTGGDFWDPQVSYDDSSGTFTFDIFESGISAERPHGGGFGTVGVFHATDWDFDGVGFSISGGEDANSFYVSDQNSPSYTVNSTGISSDYEVPADANGDHQFEFTIQATKGDNSESYNVVINILDVNEIEGDDQDNTLEGSSGVDLITTGEGNDLVEAGAGNDLIVSDTGDNAIYGDAGEDTIFLSSTSTWSSGYYAHNIGNGSFIGTGRRIAIEGWNRFNDVVDGGDDADCLVLTNSSDAFFIDDIYSGHHVSLTLITTDDGQTSLARVLDVECIKAGSGDDIIDLTSNRFVLSDNTSIDGEEGNDIIWAANGGDIIDGGAGDDTISGGAGNDTLTGGSGEDTFQFTATSGTDVITDFALSEDVIQLFYREADNHTSTDLNLANGILTWNVDDTSNDVLIDLSATTTSSDMNEVESLISFVEIV